MVHWRRISRWLKCGKGANKTGFSIDGEPLDVVRKEVKHLHVRVYPPNGRVRITVPMTVTDEVVRQVIADKLDWIRRKRAEFQKQPRPAPLRLIDGECHYLLGRPCRLRVVERPGPGRVRLEGDATLELLVSADTPPTKRALILEKWYRQQLRQLLPELTVKWEQVVGVSVAEWRIRKMSTRWGSCNIGARRIWLNLELIKKPLPCLEYVIVHELVHLLEPSHNARFRALMDRFLPPWRTCRKQLNRTVAGPPAAGL